MLVALKLLIFNELVYDYSAKMQNKRNLKC